MNQPTYYDIYCAYCGQSEAKQIPKRVFNREGEPMLDGFEENWYFCICCGYHIMYKEQTKLVG